MSESTVKKQKAAVSGKSEAKKAVKSTLHNKTLEERAEEIKAMAEASGLADNFYFLTTFERYLMQIRILDDLKKEIEEAPSVLVYKKYVRGSENQYTHPAIKEYNRTTDSANKTVMALLKILDSLGQREKEEIDPLLEIINGSDNK